MSKISTQNPPLIMDNVSDTKTIKVFASMENTSKVILNGSDTRQNESLKSVQNGFNRFFFILEIIVY